MSILKMKKVTIGGLKSEKDDIMYLLQRMGVMEITDVVDNDDENPEQQEKSRVENETNSELLAIRKTISDIDYAITRIKPFYKKKGLAKPEYSLAQVNETGEETERLEKVLSKISGAETLINELKVEISNNEKNISILKPFSSLACPVEELGRSSATTSMVGLMPAQGINALENLAAQDGVYYEKLSEDGDNAYIFIVAYNDVFEAVQGEVRGYGFSRIDLSSFKGYAKDIIAECQDEIKKSQAQLDAASKVYEEMVGDYEFLMVSSDYYSINAQRLEDEAKSDETKSTFFIEGWVCANNVKNLKKSLENLSPNCFMEDRDPTEDEFIPTALRNNKIVEPYEAVTDLYSAPDARGLDPNSVMAPFFFIFIGMMVSDAGYGVFLAIACIFALILMKPAKGSMMGKIMKVVAMAGVSTLFWGALFGSWFAMTPPEGMFWFTPMNEPLLMLTICYGLGIVHLFAGHFVNMYTCFRDGDWQGAILDTLTWLILYTGLTVMLVAAAGPLLFGLTMPAMLMKVGQWTAIVGAVSLILTQGRAKKNIFGKLISGVLSLYDVSGYLSDVLSYSRLFALGLATGVVGMVINTIVGMLMGNIFSMPIGIILFVGGHIFNIAINILGAYVHASRLQYIEYFGKFYKDGGKTFNPLSLKTKHVKLS